MWEKTSAAVFLFLVLLACGGGGGSFNTLPKKDIDAYQRCKPSSHCGDTHKGDPAAAVQCVNDTRAEYEKLPSWDARRTWLLGHGCPEAKVDATATTGPYRF